MASGPWIRRLGRAARWASDPRVVAGLLILGVHLASRLWGLDLYLAPDTRTFSRWADRLVELNFNIAALAREPTHFELPVPVYTAWLLVVVAAKGLFGDSWPRALYVLNLASVVLVGVLVVEVARRSSGSMLAALTAVVLFTFSPELVHWTRYVLSDPSFLALSFLIYVLVVRWGEAPREGGRDRWAWAAGTLCLLALFYRPAAPAIVLATVASMALLRWRPETLRGRGFGRIAAVGAGALLAATLGVAWIMQDPSRWPLHVWSKGIHISSALYGSGEIVAARPETYHAPPSTLIAYTWVALDRMLHMFQFTSRSFSRFHNLMSAIYYLPLLGLGALGVWQVAGADDSLPDRARLAGRVSLIFLACIVVQQGFGRVDFGWRYRLPMLPHLIVLASLGAAWARRRLREPRSRGTS